jgi:HK97 family phage major capsid protein
MSKQVIKELFEKKGKIHAQMQDVYRDVEKNQKGVATPEQREQFNKWDAEMIEVQDQIEFHQRAQKLADQKEASEGVEIESGENKRQKYNSSATPLERREALAKTKKSGYGSLTEDERVAVDTDVRDMKAFEKMLRYGHRELDEEERKIVGSYAAKSEKRVQTVGTDSQGGYTVPEGFAGRIVEYMAYISGLLQFANIIRTDTGNDIPFPINNDTANTGELIAENGDISSSSADLLFSVYTLGAYKFSSKMVKVSSELLQDNGVNLTDYLAKKLAERLARITNTYFTTGTGSSEPQGYITAASRGKVTASTSTWTQAELIALQDSIDPSYGSAPGVAWAMHQNLLSEIKQTAAATANFGSVWTPSFRDGEPDRLLGKPYFINQAMSSTSATGDKVFAYGDFKKFNVRIVNSFNLKVLRERYAELDQVAFFGLMRADSFLEDTGAVKYMDIS